MSVTKIPGLNQLTGVLSPTVMGCPPHGGRLDGLMDSIVAEPRYPRP